MEIVEDRLAQQDDIWLEQKYLKLPKLPFKSVWPAQQQTAANFLLLICCIFLCACVKGRGGDDSDL